MINCVFLWANRKHGKAQKQSLGFQTETSLFRGLCGCNQHEITRGFRGHGQWNTGFLRVNQNWDQAENPSKRARAGISLVPHHLQSQGGKMYMKAVQLPPLRCSPLSKPVNFKKVKTNQETISWLLLKCNEGTVTKIWAVIYKTSKHVWSSKAGQKEETL